MVKSPSAKVYVRLLVKILRLPREFVQHACQHLQIIRNPNGPYIYKKE